MEKAGEKQPNEIIRVERKPNAFVTMDKGFLENPGLSWKAKGLLAYLLSKPDNWKVVINDLASHSTDGKAAIYSGLAELMKHGHYRKHPVRDETGRRISHWEGIISEVPMKSLEKSLPVPKNKKNVIAGKRRRAAKTERTAGKVLTESGGSAAIPILSGFQEVEKNIIPAAEANSLLTDFQDIDNQDIDFQDIDCQDIENRKHNNNYISNNYISDNYLSNNYPSKNYYYDQSCLVLSCQTGSGGDGMSAKAETLTKLIKENIDYDHLTDTRPHEMQLVDEFVAIIIDAIITENCTVRIGQENKPREVVRSMLQKLDHDDIEHALDQYNSVRDKITKKKQYILTMLYNCKLENTAHYTNMANATMYKA